MRPSYIMYNDSSIIVTDIGEERHLTVHEAFENFKNEKK